MAAQHTSGVDRPARAGRLRRALPAAAQVVGAAFAFVLWAGVASPGLRLLPGIDLRAEDSIAISLQSAVLGIDDGSGRPAEERARAAADVLGLAYDREPRPATRVPEPAVVLLGEVAAAELVALARPDDRRAAAAASRPLPAEPPAGLAAERPTAPEPSPAAPLQPPSAPTLARDVPPPPPSLPPAGVPQAAQTVAFTSSVPAAATVGGVYEVSARATSGLPVRYSAAGGKGVCKVSGATVSLRRTGTCVVEARQPGNAAFEEARAQQSFAVVRAAQSIAFRSAPPAGARAGGPAYAVAATASSGLPVELSTGAGSGGVCRLSGSNVTFAGAGTCTVQADQGGDESYEPAPRVQQSFAVAAAPAVPQTVPAGRAPQALRFVTPPPRTAVAGVTEYAVAAVATSGLPVAVSVAEASATVCAVVGSVVTAIDAGTCTIEANQPGDEQFDVAAPVVQSFSVAAPAPSVSDQTIDFTSSAPAAATVGGPAYAVGATASSGLPVAFSATASSVDVCSVSGSTVTFAGAGTCTIAADQGGDARYRPAPQVRQSFAVTRASQAISFASTPPVPAAVGGPGYRLAAASSSGLPVVFAAASASAGVCSVSGSTVSLVGAGTCTVVARQDGDAAFAAAPPVQQSFTVGGGAPTLSPQTISFTSAPPAPARVGSAVYTVAAAASSGLAVVFSAAAGSAGVCTVSGSTVSLVGAGTCTIAADQAGSASYEPAPQAQQAFAVAPAPPASQTISFTSSPPAGAFYGGPAYRVAATASSGLAVSFSVAAASAGVCTVSGATVSFIGAGTCTIVAGQAGDGSYEAAPPVQQSFTVARAAQTITITSTPPRVDKRSPPYTITAASSSGLRVTFAVAARSVGVCSISGASVTFLKKGDCVVHANQAGNAGYLPAPQAQQTITVLPNA